MAKLSFFSVLSVLLMFAAVTTFAAKDDATVAAIWILTTVMAKTPPEKA